MSDLRQLLHEVAAPPTRVLDVDSLLRDAGRRRRRWVTWLASLGAVVAVGTPAGLQWASSGGTNGVVRTLPAPGSTTTTTVADQARPTSSNVAPDANTRVDTGSGGATEVPAVSAASSFTATTVPAEAADSSYPPASDCSIDTRNVAAGSTESCRFTATAVGGWWSGFAGTSVADVNKRDPSTIVSVTRAGKTTFYHGSSVSGPVPDPSGGGCGVHDLIQPGDLVEVEVYTGDYTSPGSYYEAGAGARWSCDGHP